ncbi:MAG: hypothetical protein COB58_01135 [Thalassobium sp.]|nr:MAG: hypothetical protein COB43_04460 [Oceanospirillales bacterium]PHQ88126.1 MAG: hypothetical protein COB58_01135 [Thalassobium sp.]
MKAAVMQPYLFPYIGYYQLVYSSDVFIFYDDVNYIKRGYVNRNAILLNGFAHRFTVPVPGASQNVLINNLKFSEDVSKILLTIDQAYKKSDYYSQVMPLIEKVLTQKDREITSLCMASIEVVFDYLGLQKPKLLRSSDLEYDRNLSAADKLIEISKLNECSEYVNSPGGRKLYSKEYFQKMGVNLQFINPEVSEYFQGGGEFVPYLSMIDVLMWNGKSETIKLLDYYELDS